LHLSPGCTSAKRTPTTTCGVLRRLIARRAGRAANGRVKLDPDKIDIQKFRAGCSRRRRLEAAITVEAGVITDVREADIGSILGFGFAPVTGGTLSSIDMMGTKRFAAQAIESATSGRALSRRNSVQPSQPVTETLP
jgi:hypothetical protein